MSLSLIEELWFGDFADDSAEQAAATSMVAMAAEVYGVRSFPAAAQQLISLMARTDYDIGRAVRTIESDPSLASRVLRLVNSGAYQLPARVASVQRAVTLLGARNVGDIAVGMCVLGMFGEGPGPAALVREHSQHVASIARFLAMQCRLPVDDVYTCALLHDVGKLLFLQVQEEDYRGLLDRTGSRPDMAFAAEREAFSFDHAVLAGHVLAAWGLPPPIPQAVAWHHHPARAISEGGRVAQLTSLVRIANRLSYELLDPQQDDVETISDVCSDPSATYLQLSTAHLEQVWDSLQLVMLEGQHGRVNRPARDQPPAARSDGDASPASCVECGEPAQANCQRCGRALCHAHLPPLDTRCAECEAEYRSAAALNSSGQHRLARLQIGAATGIALLAVLFFQAPALRWLWVAAALALGPMLAAPQVVKGRLKRLRRDFLEERAASRATPEP
jgi:putative nucleotidyltransferase with HDIG domain